MTKYNNLGHNHIAIPIRLFFKDNVRSACGPFNDELGTNANRFPSNFNSCKTIYILIYRVKRLGWTYYYKTMFVTSKFTHPFNMPSSNEDIMFSLRSNRISLDNPWNSVVENIGFKVSPNRLPANLKSSTEFCMVINDFSDSLLIEFCDKSSLTNKKKKND